MIDLVIVDNPFCKENRQRCRVDASSLGDLQQMVPELSAPGHWLYSRFGRMIDADAPIEDGDELVAVCFPEAPIAGVLIATLVSGLLSLGASFLIGALFGQEDEPEDRSSPVYSFGGIQNTIPPGSPVPIIYGEHRVGGQIIALWKESDNATITQYLYMLIALAEGPVNQIGAYFEDKDNLGSVTIFGDDFSIDRSDLARSPDWTRDWGSLGTVIVTSDQAQHAVGGSAGYILTNAYGQTKDNIFAEADFDTFGATSFMGIGINAADVDNYFVARYASSTSIELVERIGASETVLHTEGSLTLPVRVQIRRLDGKIRMKIDGTTVYNEDISAGAESNLNSTDLGIITSGAGTGSELGEFDGGPANTEGTLPAGMLINGLPAETFNNITAWIRMGRSEQEAIPGFDQKIQHFGVDILITTDYIIYEAQETDTEEFHLNLRFPRGLYRIDGDGDFDQAAVQVRYAWRPDGDSDWQDDTQLVISSADLTGDPDDGHITSAFDYTITIDGVSGSAPQVRIRRRGKDPTGSQVNEVWLDSVNEINGDDSHTYPDTALVALKIAATEQLNGGVPTITNLVRGLDVPFWTGAGSADEPNLRYDYSNNPAWVMADILTHRRHGLGNWIRLVDLDWQSFKDFADYCDETLEYDEELQEPAFTTDNTEAVTASSTTVVVDDAGDAAEFVMGDYVRVENEFSNRIIGITDLGGGRTQFTLQRATINAYLAGWQLHKLAFGESVSEVRHTFDGVFDQGERADEALITVARTARAMPILLGSQIRVRYEDEATPVQTFTAGNIILDSWERDFVFDGEVIHIQQIQFSNAEIDYELDLESAGYLPSINSREAPVEKTTHLRGVTRRTHARREAFFLQRASLLLRQQVRFRAPAAAIACEAGDVINISHQRFTGAATVSGRATGRLDRLVLDQDVTLAAATTYKVAIVDPTAGQTLEATVTSSDGSYPAGTVIETDGAPVPLADDTGGAAYALGVSATYLTKWRVISTRIVDPEALECEVHAIKFDADLHDDTNDHLPECELFECGGCGGVCLVDLSVLAEWFEWETTCASGCTDCSLECSGSAVLAFVSETDGVLRFEDAEGRWAELDCETETWEYELLMGDCSGVAEVGVCACIGDPQITESCEQYLEELECPPNPGGTWVPVVRLTLVEAA